MVLSLFITTSWASNKPLPDLYEDTETIQHKLTIITLDAVGSDTTENLLDLLIDPNIYWQKHCIIYENCDGEIQIISLLEKWGILNKDDDLYWSKISKVVSKMKTELKVVKPITAIRHLTLSLLIMNW